MKAGQGCPRLDGAGGLSLQGNNMTDTDQNASRKGRSISTRSGLCMACTVFTAVLVSWMLVRIGTGMGGTRMLAVTASLGFVLLPLVAGGLRSIYGRLVSIGLVFCWLGDYLGPIHFESGVLMFCAAHIGFIVAFVSRGIRRKNVLRALLPVVVVTAGVALWVLSHAACAAWPLIVAYCLLIGSMVVLSAGGAHHGISGRIGLAAAIIFFVSDIFVARSHYVQSGWLNSFGCYPLYYSACLLFGWSVYFFPPAGTTACVTERAA